MKHSHLSSGPSGHRSPSRAVALAAIEHTRHRFLQALAALVTLTVIFLLAFVATARAQDEAAALAQLPTHPAYVFLTESALPISHSLAGNYLAGRYAQRRQDWPSAETYIGEVARRDGDNEAMQQRAFLLSLGAGSYDRAATLAADIDPTDAAADVAHVFQAAQALRNGNSVDAAAYLAQLPDEGMGDFTKPLLTAWALAAQGKFVEANQMLSTADAEGIEGVISFHRGLLAEMAADDMTAVAAYVAAMREGLSLHSALVIASYFDRNGAVKVSEKIYEGIDRLFSVAPTLDVSPLATAHQKRLTPADGAALAIFDIASLLYERRAYDSAQIYASLTQLLSPDLPYARLMLGDIAALGGHYAPALAHYDAIAKGAPLYWLSRLRVAEVHEAEGNLAAAAAILRHLAEEPRTQVPSLVALGDIYRSQLNFSDARIAYDRALATDPAPEVKAPILFSRGMSSAHLDDWRAAEKDLMAALAIDPDNATLLNFIGYSLLERQQSADAAFEYISRAVSLQPEDGYILDSYGWAHFMMADYDGAITWLEKAVAMEPGDATILDHLGDAYWQVGRKTEAQFQWQRARELTKDTELRSQVEAKLRAGPEMRPRPQMVQHRDVKI